MFIEPLSSVRSLIAPLRGAVARRRGNYKHRTPPGVRSRGDAATQ